MRKLKPETEIRNLKGELKRCREQLSSVVSQLRSTQLRLRSAEEARAAWEARFDRLTGLIKPTEQR